MVTNNAATAHSNQKRACSLSTGRMVVAISDTATNCEFRWSDDGLTWTDYASDIAGFVIGSIDAYVDSGGTERLVAVWKQSGTGGGRTDAHIYAAVGTFNGARTTLTWGTPILLSGTTTNFNYPDVSCHPEGTGGVAHVVCSWNSGANNYIQGLYLVITSGGVPTSTAYSGLSGIGFSSNFGAIGGDFAVASHTYPSVAVDLSTKRVHVSGSAGTTGAGKGIRYRTAAYSAGAWTWAAEVEVDTTESVNSISRWLICRWDGTRVVLAGEVFDGVNLDHRIYESTNFTSFTTRVLADTIASASRVQSGSMAIDTVTGDVYFFGSNGAGDDHAYQKWTRATATWGPRTVLDTGLNFYHSAWFSSSVIRWIYTSGNNSPYQVKYDQLVLNVAPNTPTNLQRTGGVGTDTTPSFSADISDPNSTQAIKARFEIYQSDGVTLVGSVDSTLTAGSHTATAEYSSTLPVGTYKVQAKTIDDLGLESAYTAQVTFYVTTAVQKDLTLLWNVRQNISIDLTLLWNVHQSNTKDLTLLWNVRILVTKDLTIRWNAYPHWEDVPYESTTPTWEEVPL